MIIKTSRMSDGGNRSDENRHMSIYYFLVCDKHRERCDAASTAAGGCPLGHSQMIHAFIVRHGDCLPHMRVVSEFDDSAMQYKEPFADEPDPVDGGQQERMELLTRAQNAEAEVRKLRILYG